MKPAESNSKLCNTQCSLSFDTYCILKTTYESPFHSQSSFHVLPGRRAAEDILDHIHTESTGFWNQKLVLRATDSGLISPWTEFHATADHLNVGSNLVMRVGDTNHFVKSTSIVIILRNQRWQSGAVRDLNPDQEIPATKGSDQGY